MFPFDFLLYILSNQTNFLVKKKKNCLYQFFFFFPPSLSFVITKKKSLVYLYADSLMLKRSKLSQWDQYSISFSQTRRIEQALFGQAVSLSRKNNSVKVFICSNYLFSIFFIQHCLISSALVCYRLFLVKKRKLL